MRLSIRGLPASAGGIALDRLVDHLALRRVPAVVLKRSSQEAFLLGRFQREDLELALLVTLRLASQHLENRGAAGDELGPRQDDQPLKQSLPS